VTEHTQGEDLLASLGSLDLDDQQAALTLGEDDKLKAGGEPASSPKEQAASLKFQGDEAFKRREWKQAADLYSEAIRLNSEVPAYFSNRSAAFVEMGDFQAALEDGKVAETLDPSWPKPHFRQGIALRALKRFDMAISAFAYGQSLDPNNPSWQQEIEETERQKEARKAARERKR